MKDVLDTVKKNLPKYFKSMADRLCEIADDGMVPVDLLSFGNKFLDDALGGIASDDLIIMTARTGGGKTELVIDIARSNALSNKKIYFFALEAYKNEMEKRLKFKVLSKLFYEQPNYKEFKIRPNYQDWSYGKQADLLGKFNVEANEVIYRDYKNLFTFYRSLNFDAELFGQITNAIHHDADLIIIDHLHYFDLEDINENIAMKKLVKEIKDISLLIGKPVILVAHLRKSNHNSSVGVVPELEEIHGSSDISKIATKVIATAPAYDQPQSSRFLFPTYFKILKNRPDSSRARYAALCSFDIQKNAYLDKYIIGKINQKGDFESCYDNEVPQWANENVAPQKPKPEKKDDQLTLLTRVPVTKEEKPHHSQYKIPPGRAYKD